MSDYLYGTGNTVTNSGSYYLEPPILGLGPASVDVSSPTNTPVSASITLLGLLNLPLAAAATYTITAEANTTVTVTASSVDLATKTVLDANGGTMALAGGLLSALSGVTVNIANGGTFSGAGLISAASGLTINFGSGGGALDLASSSTGLALLSGATINGFGANDQIILDNADQTSTISSVSYDSTLGVSTVTFSNGDTLLLNGQYTNQVGGTGTYIATSSVSAGAGTELTASCFCAGTLIATPTGEVPIETLQAGDLVTLSDGRTAAISWLGLQTIATAFADTLRVAPIRIKAEALADGVPARDLRLSPDHAVLVDGLLIQAGALVNHHSIVRETDLASHFVYYHIEVADHSLILAENTPAETFIDNVARLNFDNWSEHKGSESIIPELPLPRAKSTRQVPGAIRNRLLGRAGAHPAPARFIAA